MLVRPTAHSEHNVDCTRTYQHVLTPSTAAATTCTGLARCIYSTTAVWLSSGGSDNCTVLALGLRFQGARLAMLALPALPALLESGLLKQLRAAPALPVLRA
jgi:hypothetical protein